MAGLALNQGRQSPPEGGEEDPIAAAQKITKEMIATDMISTEVKKKKAEVREAEAKADKATAEAARVVAGETGAKASDAAVKVTGNFDVQQMLSQQTTDLKTLTLEAQQQAATQAGISDDLRERLHAKEMEVLKTSFEAQIGMLGKMIEQNASRGSFMDQYNVTKEFATQLGFAAPGAGSSDIQTTLALKKMEFEETRANRRESREAKAEERRWQMGLRKLDDDREATREEQARQSKRDEMFANAPAMVGSAIAKGFMARGEPEAAAGGKSRQVVEVGVGESGTVKCANKTCLQPVAIGPTAKTAICAGCETKYSIRRVPVESSGEETEEE